MNSKRTAFTLMEMLVVVALLGTLLGISAAGMRVADNMARETRTRATIRKLNRFVMEKYASYQYRRVPGRTSEQRLTNLRQLQRYELPDHWEEVHVDYSPRRVVAASRQGDRNTSEFPSAELLYQIVMSMPEADSAFTSMEIADTDGNGLNEFVDGWGTPIYFIRWPAGHYDDNNGAISKIQNGVDADPFDPAQVDSGGYAVFSADLFLRTGPCARDHHVSEQFQTDGQSEYRFSGRRRFFRFDERDRDVLRQHHQPQPLMKLTDADEKFHFE